MFQNAGFNRHGRKNEKMVEWKVRLYRNGDEEQIVDLLNSQLAADANLEEISSRSNAISMDSWIWNFKNNPYGFLIAVSEHKEKIIGYMGLFCYDMKVGDKIIRGSQGSRLFVHPDFRRQGMFLEIGKTLLKAAGERGVTLSIAFPNEPAYRGHIQYGWFEAYKIPVMTTYFDISSILRKRKTLLPGLVSRAINYYYSRKRKGKIPSEDLSIKKITRFDKRIDDFWNRVAERHKMMNVRNSTYLNWRYLDKPKATYETFIAEKEGQIEGYLVTDKQQDETANVGWIIDVLCSSRSVFLNLVRHAVEHLNSYSVDSIRCFIQENKSEYEWMKKSGFTGYPRPKVTMIARINSPEISQALYDEASKDWYVTYGDGDFM